MQKHFASPAVAQPDNIQFTMTKVLFVFALPILLAFGLLTIGSAARASVAAQVPDLPPPILRAHQLKVDQRDCEAKWAEIPDAKISTFDLGNGNRLWIVPCAKWMYNVEISVYLTILEPSHPDGYITKPISFLAWSLAERTYTARAVVLNAAWNGSTQNLFSEDHSEGKDFCGSRVQYKWSPAQQNFTAVAMYKQDDCLNPLAEWEQVLPIGAIAAAKPGEKPAPHQKQGRPPLDAKQDPTLKPSAPRVVDGMLSI